MKGKRHTRNNESLLCDTASQMEKVNLKGRRIRKEEYSPDENQLVHLRAHILDSSTRGEKCSWKAPGSNRDKVGQGQR